MANNTTESQPYTLIRKEKEFEIRYYPASTVAMVSSPAKNYKELSGTSFRKLAGYIFGGNREKKSIAMTTPVHLDIHQEGSSMAFVMPSNLHEKELPSPNDPNVMIKSIADEYVAAIRFSGFASDESIRKHSEYLKNALVEAGIDYSGHFRFLGYNPPYQLFGRRNEIIVKVKGDFIS